MTDRNDEDGRRPGRLRRGAARAAAGAPLLILLMATADRPVLEAGAWERRIEYQSATRDGQPVPDADTPETDVKRRCMSPALAADPARFVFPPKRDGCEIVSRSMAGGLLAFTGKCAEAEGRPGFSISGEGRYDRTSYSMETVTELRVDEGSPILMRMRISARHMGACTRDDTPLDVDLPPAEAGQ